MRRSSRFNRGENVSTAPPSSTTRPLPPRGTDENFFWLLAAACLVVVGLIHALFIGVALFQSVAAIPIAISRRTRSASSPPPRSGW
jgi:hypothetical protein